MLGFVSLSNHCPNEGVVGWVGWLEGWSRFEESNQMYDLCKKLF